MSTVNSSTSAAADPFAAINAAGKSSTSATSGSSEADSQNRFLTLLVTQLKNQDPLNPMDNAQVTSQLAQINTVSGINQLNSTMGQLLDAYGNAQSMQAAGMIGKSVMVTGATLPLQSGQAVGGATLAAAADKVTVDILDSAGNVLQTESLGAKAAGNFGFAWDGSKANGTKAADGNYTFKVTATQGGKSVGATALEVGTVSAVTRTSGGFQLDLGTLGSVDFKNVQEIF